MYSNGTPDFANRTHPSPGSNSTASPKKSTKEFRVSPFKPKKNNLLLSSPGENQKAHVRNQSYDQVRSPNSEDHKEWINLIRPVPQGSSQNNPTRLPFPDQMRFNMGDQPPYNTNNQPYCPPNQNENPSFVTEQQQGHSQLPQINTPESNRGNRSTGPGVPPAARPSASRAQSNLASFFQQPGLPLYSLPSPSESIPPNLPSIDHPQKIQYPQPQGGGASGNYRPPSHPIAKNQQPHSSGTKQPAKEVRKRKFCHSCKNPINGQFLRALNSPYHLECFKCHHCGKQCSSKFFSFDITNSEGWTEQVPLCEYDYFNKLDLICFNCDTALRGPYITALGNKYHLEHFKCSACGKVFESDESYYENGNEIYCHFHYSKLFATKCEGCNSSIAKQFVELYKGGKEQKWHPECYMVFKFWNVCFTPEAVGLPKEFPFESASSNAEDQLPVTKLFEYEQKIESLVFNCWMVLSGFEETTAQCVSEMLLAASTGNLSSGLQVTGKLILYVEVLFNALEFVQNMCSDLPDKASTLEISLPVSDDVYSADAFRLFQHLRKEPRNIAGKIMSYLAILRRSHQIAASGSLSSELLSVITGCAHYLKILIRIGLKNALKLNVLRSDTKASDNLLTLTNKYEEIEMMDKLEGEARVSIKSRLAIPYNATDLCRACLKSIEKSCIRYGNFRWHPKCFECMRCHRKPNTETNVELYLYGSDGLILCPDCAKQNPSNSGIGYSSRFVKVSDLAQLMYLLRIACLRSTAAIKNELAEILQKGTQPAQIGDIHEETISTEEDFSKTLDDVTSLRTKRESQNLKSSVKRTARKSVILESHSGTAAKSDNVTAKSQKQKESSGSLVSLLPVLEDSDQAEFHFGELKTLEEPSLRLVSNSLDRTTDLLKNEKSLTLDDIPRIVAAEQAREQRPNAFKHHNLLYQKRQQQLQSPGSLNNRNPSNNYLQPSNEPQNPASNHKSKYYSELSKNEHFILRHIAVEAFLRTSDQFTKEELVALVQVKKSTFWDKFKFYGDKHLKSTSVFGGDLSEVSKRYGVDSELGIGPSQLRIPILVDDIIRALRQKDMSVEGIFRLNGNIKNLRELTEQINSNPQKSPALEKYSAVQLAALMKKWLRELPNPLLTFNLYDLWIASRKQSDTAKCKRILHLTYCMLPRSHRNLLEVLLYFFSWVASFSDIDEETGSKMDTHNLATVLAPNILHSSASATDNGTNQSSDAHFLAIEVVNQLIEMHEKLAIIPGDVWEFYEKLDLGKCTKLDQISTKEVMNKIQKTLQECPDHFAFSLKVEATPTHNNTIKRGQATVHGNEDVAV